MTVDGAGMLILIVDSDWPALPIKAEYDHAWVSIISSVLTVECDILPRKIVSQSRDVS